VWLRATLSILGRCCAGFLLLGLLLLSLRALLHLLLLLLLLLCHECCRLECVAVDNCHAHGLQHGWAVTPCHISAQPHLDTSRQRPRNTKQAVPKIEVGQRAVRHGCPPGRHQLQRVLCELCAVCKDGAACEQACCVVDCCVMCGTWVQLAAEVHLVPVCMRLWWWWVGV
jgi:hypothetical protein